MENFFLTVIFYSSGRGRRRTYAGCYTGSGDGKKVEASYAK